MKNVKSKNIEWRNRGRGPRTSSFILRTSYFRCFNRGFSLVEALVALAILSVSLTPIFAQITASFRVSRAIEENLIASALAQEGVELIRGIRDDNWFSGSTIPFPDLFDECAAGCTVQFDETFVTAGGGRPLRRDDHGRFRYDRGTETRFSRTVTVTEESPTHLVVVSEVTWTSNAPHAVSVEAHLFDWLNP